MKTYSYTPDKFGNLTITRHPDGASAYLQGESADRLRAALVNLKRKHRNGVQTLLSDYDEILTQEIKP